MGRDNLDNGNIFERRTDVLRRAVQIILLLGLALPVLAFAGTVNDVGKTTHSDLQKQAQGRDSVPVRPLPKAAAKRIYKRYLKSYEHPIPDQYDKKKSFSSGDSGG